MKVLKITAEKSFEIECQDVMDCINDWNTEVKVLQLPEHEGNVYFLAIAPNNEQIAEVKNYFHREAECEIEDVEIYNFKF